MRITALKVSCLVVIAALFIGAACGAERAALLNVGKGELPNDTALENKTKLSIVDAPRELGGKALQVDFAAGDSFGMSRGAGVRDWRPFTAVEFAAFNPTRQEVALTFTVRHRGTTGFPTRIDAPLTFKPGKTVVRLKLGELLNVDRSRPDLSHVTHWYLACPPGSMPTLYFTDFWLVGEDSVPSADAAGPSRIKTDPARLARIRDAKMPLIKQPVRFDTPAADAILSALEVFPPDNAFNQLIDDWPLHPNSKNVIASIGADKPFRYNPDMAFVLVPPGQPRVEVEIVEYPGESDLGPYPVPDIVPIEGWPVGYQRDGGGRQTLAEVQRRPAKYEGDRHAIVVDPVNRRLYEFFTFGRTTDGWAAGQASIFDLSSNKLRPDGWTSADAAGLPIFPAVVRYDELQRGVVEHAMRVTVRRTRRAYVHPATHFASRLTDENLPRMGERLRLRGNFDTKGFSPPVQAILKGLQRYGMFVADNGIDWAISVAPDPRIPVLHEELRKIRGSDFEVVIAPE